MIHKLLRNSLLNLIITLIAGVILSVDSITLAQMPVGEPSVKHAIASAQSHAAGRVAVSDPRKAQLGAIPLNENVPFFLPAVAYTVGYTGGHPPTAVAIADLNGDGHPDIVAFRGTDASKSFGNGTGCTSLAHTAAGKEKAMKRLNYINSGGTDAREVFDRKLPTELDPECKRSQERGWTGKGLNEKTMNESLQDFNLGVDITEAE